MSAAERLAEGRTAHFPFLVRRNYSFIPNRELNDNLRPARRYFARHVNSQPVAGWYLYSSRYGHNREYNMKKSRKQVRNEE